MPKQIVKITSAPRPLADYSHAWVVDKSRLVFVSGQISVDIAGKPVGPGNMALQTQTALENLKNVLKDAGSKLSDVLKLNIYVTDVKAFREKTGEIRIKNFPKDFPASTLVEVRSLAHPDFMVEIEAVAAIG